MENLIWGTTTILICSAIYFFGWKKYRQQQFNTCLFAILLAGLLLRVFVATDGYLHTWDEKYHALVAKNMIDHPLKPTLYEQPVLKYDYWSWTTNHVWLDKGPVPMWAMAFSIAVFGTNEIAPRLPSILVSLIAIYLTFLMAAWLFDRKIALLAAFLHSIHGLLIEISGGRVSSDHIEVFFIFFVQLALLLGIYSIVKKKSPYIFMLMGLATGLAILSKWTPALIVFPVWAIGAYLSGRFSIRDIALYGGIAATSCAVTVLPWFLYILNAFPDEAVYVFKKYAVAYYETVEEHHAPWYYYLHKMGVLFGELIYVPLLLFFYRLYRKQARWQSIMLHSWWIMIVLIFSFASTKRFTYLLICAPAFFIITSHAWFYFYEWHDRTKYRTLINLVLFLLILLPARYSIERIKPFHSRDRRPAWVAELKMLDRQWPDSTVFFNVPQSIEGMYYTDYVFYNHLPTAEEIERVESMNYHIVINEKGINPEDPLFSRPSVSSIKMAPYKE